MNGPAVRLDEQFAHRDRHRHRSRHPQYQNQTASETRACSRRSQLIQRDFLCLFLTTLRQRPSEFQGAAQVRQLFADSTSIFILPPSKQALRERLNNRGQDDSAVIEKRIAAATEEMSHYIEADFLVVNDDFEVALNQLMAIISAQHCRLPVASQEDLLSDLLS